MTRFTPQILDEIRARLPVSQVVGRKVALKKAGREYKGLSPFKTEKTPSFFVNDQKGFYHCFASGEHGDIFTFVMKTEGLEFPEAVERLAEEAGVPLPKDDPRERNVEAEDQRDAPLPAARNLGAILRRQPARRRSARKHAAIWKSAGWRARRLQRFRLGYAPNGRHALAGAPEEGRASAFPTWPPPAC